MFKGPILVCVQKGPFAFIIIIFAMTHSTLDLSSPTGPPGKSQKFCILDAKGQSGPWLTMTLGEVLSFPKP